MKTLALFAALFAASTALPSQANSRSLSAGFSQSEIDALLARSASSSSYYTELSKRRGGGGHGGGGEGGGGEGGGSGSGSGSGSGEGSGGSSSGSSGSGSKSGSSGSSGTAPPSGSTRSSPTFGGGSVYPGGSRTSYVAGGRSPSGISPSLLSGAAIGFAASSLFFYPYHTHYYDTAHGNRSLPVECVCQQNDPCGCDDTGSQSDIQEMLSNSTVAKEESVNGTTMVVINGTLLQNQNTNGAAKMGIEWWGVGVIAGAVIWGL